MNIKRIILFIIMAAAVFSVNVSAAETKTIDSFAGYPWGTELSVIEENEVSEESKDKIHIHDAGDDFDEETGVDELRIWKTDAMVGGYEVNNITFFFRDGLLVGGEYELNNDDQERGIPDLVEKYTSVYGEPLLHKHARSPYRDEPDLWLWIDENRNYVFIESYFGTMLYGTNDELMVDYVDHFSEEGILEVWYKISVKAEINKIGNLDGI